MATVGVKGLNTK